MEYLVALRYVIVSVMDVKKYYCIIVFGIGTLYKLTFYLLTLLLLTY